MNKPKNYGAINNTRTLGRPRLIALLKRSSSERLTLLCGAPGRGKTTLVKEFLEEQGDPFFWYSLRSQVPDSDHFITAMRSCIDSYYPDVGGAGSTSQAALSAEQRESAFLNWLFSKKLEQDLFVVLDDYQQVSPQGTFDDFLQFLINSAPANFHFIIISRQDPSWDLLHKKVQRKIFEIKDSQLCFKLKETRDFCQEIYNLGLEGEQLEVFYHLTEGWAPAMVIFAEEISVDPECLNNYQDYPLEEKILVELEPYLEKEIFQCLTPAQRNFLMAVSIVEEVSLDLAGRLVGEEARPVFEQLYYSNLLLTWVEDKADTFRSHKLWRAFLLRKACATWGTKQINELHLRAAGYFFEQGRWQESFRHFVEGEDSVQAIKVFKKGGPPVLDFNLAEKFHSLITRFSLDKLDSDPWVQLAYAFFQRFRDAALCYHYLNLALEGFRKNWDRAGEIWTLCLKTQALFFYTGGLHPMEEVMIVETPPQSSPSDKISLRAYLQAHIALSHCWLSGKLEEAVRLAEEARRTALLLQDNNLLLWSCGVLGLALIYMGDFEAARGYLMEAQEKLDQPETDQVLGALIPFSLALDKAFLGEFESARGWLLAAQRKAQKLGLDTLIFYLNILESYVVDYSGDGALSDKLLAEMEARCSTYLRGNNWHLRSFLFAAKAHHAFLNGRDFQAVDLARQALALRQKAGGEVFMVRCLLTLGTALRELGEYEEAEDRLLEAANRSKAMGSSFFRAAAHLQLSLLYIATEQPEQFRHYLGKVCKLAIENDYLHFFLGRSDDLGCLIDRAKSICRYQSYLEKLSFYWSVPLDKPQIMAAERWVVDQHAQKPVRILMLGPFVLEIGGVANRDKGSRKALYLLKLLSIKKEPCSVARLVEELWPEWDNKLAMNNFYFTLHQLRKILGDKHLVSFKDGVCEIDPEFFWTDVEQYQNLLKKAEQYHRNGDSLTTLELLEQADKLYRGELLEGENLGETLSLEREVLAGKQYVGLLRQGTILMENSDWVKSLNVLNRAAGSSFADENVFRLLMLAHYSLGDKMQALDVYRRLSDYLKLEMGTRPHPVTDLLRDRISSGQELYLPEAIKWVSGDD